MDEILSLIEESLQRNWTLDAVSDFHGPTFQYKDVARKIAKLHILFETIGLQKGERIAICGRNSANWAVAFLAALTYEAVVVPVLHEFKSDDIHHIIQHSEARLLFVSSAVMKELSADSMPDLLGILDLADYNVILSRSDKLLYARGHLNELFGRRYPNRFEPTDVVYTHPNPESLAVLNYTSGSTGRSKGVMIPHRALASNLQFAYGVVLLNPGDRVVSLLPMAHTYGMSFEFLWEITVGAHIWFFTRTPGPKVILQAFEDIRPNLIVTVPLIVEKIVRRSVMPRLNSFPTNIISRIPLLKRLIYHKMRDQLVHSFGNNFYEVIVGGAGVSQDVDRFLHAIRFPYTVGYGATECAPIICYEDWKSARVGSCGKAVINMQIRIDSDDPEHKPGEVLCRGKNIMLGYYKNEELTRQTIDEDGWLHTGDLGVVDSTGRLYIRGRSKNLILGPSGQNIYPEEIEDKLGALSYVADALVVEREGKIVALVYPDNERLAADQMTDFELLSVMEDHRMVLNRTLPVYSQIASIELRSEPFEKTPKNSIKRYLYQ